MAVLISNIGNNNLKHGESKDFTEYLSKNYNDKNDFKEVTNLWWQAIQEEEPGILKEIESKILRIDILHYYLDKPDVYKIEHLYIFATNQDDPKYDGQDTIYAGNIVKYLVNKFYPEVEVHLIIYEGNPTSDDRLMNFIAPKVKNIKKTHSLEECFYYNDAGGTPQMKLVLKELLLYYLEPKRLKISYVDPLDQQREVQRDFYKKYTYLSTAKSFVHLFNYSGALNVLDQIPDGIKVNPFLKDYLLLSQYRINFDFDKAKEAYEKSTSEIRKNKLWQHGYFQKNLRDAWVPFQIFKTKADFRFNIFEAASICQLYFMQKNYTLAIATYYRLCEEMGQCFAEAKGNRFYGIDQRDEFVKKHQIQLQKEYPKARLDRYGLPFLLAYGISNANESNLKELFGELIKTCSYVNGTKTGLNDLRNQCFLAHSNQAITKEKIEETVPGFFSNILPQIWKLLGMPEQNIYEQINQELEDLFMNE
jgi:hypothetical protein